MDKTTDEDHYLEILIKQYSECWRDIREYSSQIWQMPTVLTATISFVGILYYYWRDIQIGRVLALLLGLGFTSVIMIALKKHRFFSNNRVDDFRTIQDELKELFTAESFKGKFVDIKWKTEELAKDTFCINRISAYKWQFGLVVTIFLGIIVLLLREFMLLVLSHM